MHKSEQDHAPGLPGTAPQSSGMNAELLCQLWAEALDVPAVGLDDDFFALGGDSLIVARIVISATRRGFKFDPLLFVQCRTVREMQREISKGQK